MTCLWRENEDGNWETSCQEIFVLIEATPGQNGMRFCCYCGRPLNEARLEREAVQYLPVRYRVRRQQLAGLLAWLDIESRSMTSQERQMGMSFGDGKAH